MELLVPLKAPNRDVLRESYETLMALAQGLVTGKAADQGPGAGIHVDPHTHPQRKQSSSSIRRRAKHPNPTEPPGATGTHRATGTKPTHGTAHEHPFGCPDCGKSFPWASHLARHRRMHTMERPFRCPECGWAFSQRANLRKHVAVRHCRRCHHSRERRHRCPVCGKGFPWASHLQRHRRVHTGERPYTCSRCGDSFAQGTHLNRHLRRHLSRAPKRVQPDAAIGSHEGCAAMGDGAKGRHRLGAKRRTWKGMEGDSRG
ncbi:zinc finger protein CKR1-like [Melopsittacus undulatus]|uniref:zinc finger protein CKR1-like n=1 Tax=Melopsittacus undulatus TaxID=13146 RepID=UPI00146F4A61|nr:zinc finger protein CKR1-like [Melopsittacus undulatus]